jgi:hypothetical protein
MKIVVNKCFGGFGLSAEAIEAYAKKKGFEVFGYRDNRQNDVGFTPLKDRSFVRYKTGDDPFVIYWLKIDLGDEIKADSLNDAEWFHERDIPRNDEALVDVVEELKEKANGSCAYLSVIEIPDDVDFEIDEYDGLESIHEKHRSW